MLISISLGERGIVGLWEADRADEFERWKDVTEILCTVQLGRCSNHICLLPSILLMVTANMTVSSAYLRRIVMPLSVCSDAVICRCITCHHVSILVFVDRNHTTCTLYAQSRLCMIYFYPFTSLFSNDVGIMSKRIEPIMFPIEQASHTTWKCRFE